jgi:5-methylcytosine-specific restriction endonuclease McrA
MDDQACRLPASRDDVLPILPKRDEIVPLTADVRRVHFNVDKQVVRKLEAAREGLSHAIPGATMEQVLEVALDLLLEKQARARGQVKKPRTSVAVAAPRAERQPAEATAQRMEPLPLTKGRQNQLGNCSVARPEGRGISPPTTAPLPPRREGPRDAIPAAVRRAVWARDGGHCTWPLDGGGVCGSTHRLELDHVIPWAEWGPSTVENLRVVCRRHNALAARRQFGERLMRRYVGGAD